MACKRSNVMMQWFRSIKQTVVAVFRREPAISLMNGIFFTAALVILILCCQCSSSGSGGVSQGDQQGQAVGNPAADMPGGADAPGSGSSPSTFYIDPVSGSMDNDGSSVHPWRTLDRSSSPKKP